MRRGSTLLITAAVMLSLLPATAQAAPTCTIWGSAAADILRGTNGSDVICARDGSDKVFGRGGADVIKGGRGDDVLVGGPAADRLIGGAGRDFCRDKGETTYLQGCERRSQSRLRPRSISFPCCTVRPGPGDLTAPEVLGVYFMAPYVDTFSESSIGLWIEASESQSGIGRIEIEIEGPDGHWRELAFGSDSPYSGASTSVDVPPSTPEGKYRVSTLRLIDRAGNQVALDKARLHELGFDAAFDVFVGPDTGGPQLTSYSMTPETLDTSAGPGSVRFSLEGTDDLSGVDRAVALIRLPNSEPPGCFPCGRHAPSKLISGTIYDGAWEENFPLPQFAMPGVYEITAVVLYDRARNETVYDRDELEDLGYPVEFTQTGIGDTEPPQIIDFWMSPGALQASLGNRKIQFFLHVKDDLSGVGEDIYPGFERLRVDIHPPHASEWSLWDGGVTLVSGTDLDGVWRFEKALPPEAETGTWTIPAIEATDRAGNERLLREEKLKATGWDLTFENLP
jgi:RTX calcium-binding nonapeptide repeat (4 copies)